MKPNNKTIVEALSVTIRLAQRYQKLVPFIMESRGLNRHPAFLNLMRRRNRQIKQTRELLKSLQISRQTKKGGKS